MHGYRPPQKHKTQPLSTVNNLRAIQTSRFFMPNIFNTNIRGGLASKLDELESLFHNNRVDVACLTETWLHHKISSHLIRAKYYSCYRKDRNDGRQDGGVAFCVRDDVSCTRLSDLESPKFEILWLLYRQPLMPRILSHILIGGIYHPPAAKHTDTIAYILDCLDAVSKLHPGLGILLTGDFNQLPDSAIRNFPLTQIVRRPTRGKTILDKMFTDCRDWDNEPEILPPVSGLITVVSYYWLMPTASIILRVLPSTGAAMTKTVKICLPRSCDALIGCCYIRHSPVVIWLTCFILL